MAIISQNVIVHFGFCVILCCSLGVSEASAEDAVGNAEDIVMQSSTTEELIDIICSCREEVSVVDYIEPLNPYPHPRDCYDIQQMGQSQSGRYDIFPFNEGTQTEAVRVSCNMDTDKGGWTVFQKREIGSVDFNRGWEEYKTGFGYVGGDFWLGNEYLYTITNQKKYEMRIDMQEMDGTKHFITHDLFRLGDEASGYRLYIQSFLNNPGNCQEVFELGMEDGRIHDRQISASSAYNGYKASDGRLNLPDGDGSQGAWAARTNDANQWIQCDLGVSRLVAGVILQGRSNSDQWVKQYKVQYADGDAELQYVVDANGNEVIFDGNADRNTPVTSMFPASVKATSVRIQPTAWNSHISMRFELLGCEGDSLAANHNFQAFSTQDTDNDPDNESNCALITGPWWYGVCDNSGLNGPYQLEALSGNGGILWNDFKGFPHHLKYTEMKIRPVISE